MDTNCDKKNSDFNEKINESINVRISDAGIYSLCGLTAVLFQNLFPEKSNREFCENTIGALLSHLGLPSNQVKNSMFAIMDGEGGNLEDFVTLLKNEEILQISCNQLIEELILFAIREGDYDARIRVIILKIANLLNIPKLLVQFYEESVIEMLSKDLPVQSDEEIKEKAKRIRKKKIKRYFMIGLVGISGGAILGLTGGLAAPFVAAGAGAIIGGAGAAALGSTAGIAIIGSLFGVAGAGLTGYKMKKRVGDIEEFAFDSLNEEHKELHITIAISGWISEKGSQGFIKPWNTLQNTREQYCVRYESGYLLELGRALEYFLGFAVSVAAQEALKFTILSGIIAAIAWPATLVTFANVIDNPWGVCIRRSAEAGKHLADILLSREQGRRPVSLIGFSLGARVIFFCLLELSQRPDSEGIIQDAILLGAPVSGSIEYWRKFSKVVSGRLVNGYCRGDWLLKFLYRTSTASIKIAGLDAIDWKDRRMENIDLSGIVNGHMDYYKKMSFVLKTLGVQVNENNLTSNTLLRKSKTGISITKNDNRDFKSNEKKYLNCDCTIRMSISDPSFSHNFRTYKDNDNLNKKNENIFKIKKSLSLENLNNLYRNPSIKSSFRNIQLIEKNFKSRDKELIQKKIDNKVIFENNKNQLLELDVISLTSDQN